MKKLFKYERSRFFHDPNATLAIERQIDQQKEAQHLHEFVELVIVLAGSARHRVEKLQYRLEAGDIFVINPRRAHGYEQPEGFHIANILIREDFFQKVNPAIAALPGYHSLFTLAAAAPDHAGFESRTHLDGENFRQAVQWVEQLERETAPKVAGGFAMAEAYLLLLIGLICRAGESRAQPRESPVSQIGRLLTWMESRAEQPIRIEEMARVAAMSERTLLRHFQEATGQSPLGYLIELRLRKARVLLENPGRNLSHDEIAERCGFENGNYFARRFKLRFGISPREWRKSHANWSRFK